jgi:hypothetical protein
MFRHIGSGFISCRYVDLDTITCSFDGIYMSCSNWINEVLIVIDHILLLDFMASIVLSFGEFLFNNLNNDVFSCYHRCQPYKTPDLVNSYNVLFLLLLNGPVIETRLFLLTRLIQPYAI